MVFGGIFISILYFLGENMSIARNDRSSSASLYGVAWAALLSLLLPFAVWADDDEGEIEEIVSALLANDLKERLAALE